MAAPDYTDEYNTQLTPEQEAVFRAWLLRSGKAKDLFDYDLRGAWLKGVAQDERGHLPDTFKKPNHPTFSNQSIYSTKDMPGGEWVMNPSGNTWTYRATPFVVQMHGLQQLMDYFQRVERGNRLLVP